MVISWISLIFFSDEPNYLVTHQFSLELQTPEVQYMAKQKLQEQILDDKQVSIVQWAE